VDGRQPGYSIGVTGKELADILISVGVTEAAILDGGASSEMIYENEIVNKPSTGKERLLASGFVIRLSGEGQGTADRVRSFNIKLRNGRCVAPVLHLNK
jgi:hypothetical protein